MKSNLKLYKKKHRKYVATLKRFDLATLPTSTDDGQTSAVASMQIRDFFPRGIV